MPPPSTEPPPSSSHSNWDYYLPDLDEADIPQWNIASGKPASFPRAVPRSYADKTCKKQFYVVFRGRKPGIFANWNMGAKPAVENLQWAVYGGWPTYEVAYEAWKTALKKQVILRFVSDAQ